MLGPLLDEASSTVVLLERDGRFFVYETNLGIIGADHTVEGAYRKFGAAKAALIEEAERAGLRIGPLVTPAGAPTQIRPAGGGQRSVLHELAMFLAKTAIFILLVGAIGATIAVAVGRATSGVKPIGMADIADKAAEVARDLSSLPPEKKNSLRQSIGVLSRELGPVIDAWRNPPSQ